MQDYVVKRAEADDRVDGMDGRSHSRDNFRYYVCREFLCLLQVTAWNRDLHVADGGRPQVAAGYRVTTTRLCVAT